MSKFIKFIIGLLLTMLLACVAHFMVRDRLAHTLEQRSAVVLAANNQSWAKVKFIADGDAPMRYRIGYLSGSAPSDEARVAAKTQLLTALSTYSLDGGVHDIIQVVDHSTAAKGPYIWRAQIKDKQVLLSGMVPSDAARADLVSYATDKFKNSGYTVVDQMKVAAGAPDGDWTTTAKHGIAAIATLGNDYTELSNTNLTVIGTATSTASKHSVETALAMALPAGFSALPDITGADVPAPKTEIDLCQKQFNAIMAASVVEFDTGKASLRKQPNIVLDKIADLAIKCPGTTLEVGGHTDKRGNAASNMVLSKARAQTVVIYLKSKNLAASRLTSKGYGSTQPLDTEDTEAAYQKNRRIQFTVGSVH